MSLEGGDISKVQGVKKGGKRYRLVKGCSRSRAVEASKGFSRAERIARKKDIGAKKDSVPAQGFRLFGDEGVA